MSNGFDLVAIVTGGSGEDGREIACELASRGCAVIVVYLHDQGQAEATVMDILAANGTAITVRADIADALDVERLFAEAKAAFGVVDVIVHAAPGGSVVNETAARELARGGTLVCVGRKIPVTPGLARKLRTRDILITSATHRAEPHERSREIADLVLALDRRRRGNGS